VEQKLKGDLKANETIAGLEANDYDVATLHIPYGPGMRGGSTNWDIKQYFRFVFSASTFSDVRFQDLGMNCTIDF